MAEEGSGVIYNEIHSIIFKKRQNEEKECNYRITIEFKTGHIGKVLSVKLTDDVDSGFLFLLLLTQEDFLVLKSEQGLRVDFENFPRQFTKLLSDCRCYEKHQFTLMLDDSDTDVYPSHRTSSNGLFLKVIERNEFKYLCHLSLRMVPGTDEDIKQHLCNKLKCAHDHLAREKIKNGNMEEELNITKVKLVENTKKLNDLEVRLAEEKSAVRLEANQQLNAERDRQNHERKELETKHEAVINELKSDIDLLTHKNRMCHESKSALESTLRERTVQNESLEKDVSRLTTENTALKGTVANMEQRLLESEQTLAAMRRKLSSTEDSIKELSAHLHQAKREAQAAREHESALSANLRHSERQLQVTSYELVQVRQEVVTLKEELTSKRSKIGNMLSVAQMLEKELDAAKSDLNTKSKLLETTEENQAKLSMEVDELKTKLASVELELKEQEDTIKRQYDVNSYLHRKLNETDTMQNSTSQPKTTSFSASLIAKNIPSLNKTSLASTPAGERVISLPPWMTGNGTTPDSVFQPGKGGGDISSLKPRLDPSYLLPDTDPKSKLQQVKHNSDSAYFRRLTARKDAS